LSRRAFPATLHATSQRCDETESETVPQAPTITTQQIASALRTRALALSPADIGLTDANREHSRDRPVYGVVVETAHPGAVASLVALADGSVSFYVSDGAGCIGCGQHREVRLSAADLLQAAEQALPVTAPTADVGLPAEGHVRIYLLTRDGLRSADTRLETMHDADMRLGVVYFAAQRVIRAFERVGAGQSLAQELEAALGGNTHNRSGEEPCLSVGNAVRRLRT